MSVHAVITDAEGRVLQLKATYGSRDWGLPGGNLDRGETIHEALRRECLEELGCEIEIRELTGIYYHARFNSQALIFRCELARDARIRLSREHSEARYFALEELSPVQRKRVEDCLGFDGQVRSAAFGR